MCAALFTNSIEHAANQRIKLNCCLATEKLLVVEVGGGVGGGAL